MANKCSIASRIDCFTDTPTSTYGEMLRDQVEERLNFYENGTTPRSNEDVMKEAVDKVKKSHLNDAMECFDDEPVKPTDSPKKRKKSAKNEEKRVEVEEKKGKKSKKNSVEPSVALVVKGKEEETKKEDKAALIVKEDEAALTVNEDKAALTVKKSKKSKTSEAFVVEEQVKPKKSKKSKKE